MRNGMTTGVFSDGLALAWPLCKHTCASSQGCGRWADGTRWEAALSRVVTSPHTHTHVIFIPGVWPMGRWHTLGSCTVQGCNITPHPHLHPRNLHPRGVADGQMAHVGRLHCPEL
eukprot:363443-Chlamydomonas_euryale.AAC.9